MAAPAHAEEIPRFIDTQIKPHLNKILRVLGNERQAGPKAEFIMAGGDHKSHSAQTDDRRLLHCYYLKVFECYI